MIINQKGVTIVETLVAIGIMAIMMVGFSSMLLNQQKETKSVSEILAGLDLQKNLISALADGSVCNHILNNPTQLTFNSNNLPRDLFPSLPIYASVVSGVVGAVIAQEGQPASVFSTSMVVKDIRLNITSGSGSTYTGNWIIDFDETKSVRPHKPVTVSTILKVDSSAPGNTKITGCMGSGGADSGLGFDQDWTSVISSRAFDTDYSNTTDKPIVVSITGSCGSSGSGNSVFLNIDGVIVGRTYASLGNMASGGMISGIVPKGKTYRVTRNHVLCNINDWAELR